MEKDKLILYGTGWCPKTAFISNYLQSIDIAFELKNVETDISAENEVRALYGGKLKFPTITKDGHHIQNPSLQEINQFLKIKQE
jgi:glutaredoxin